MKEATINFCNAANTSPYKKNGEIKNFAEIYELDLLRHVSPKCPPVFSIMGSYDIVINTKDVIDFHHRLHKHKVFNHLIILEYGHH